MFEQWIIITVLNFLVTVLYSVERRGREIGMQRQAYLDSEELTGKPSLCLKSILVLCITLCESTLRRWNYSWKAIARQINNARNAEHESWERARERERQTDRQREREKRGKGRLIDRQTDGQTGKQTDRQTDTWQVLRNLRNISRHHIPIFVFHPLLISNFFPVDFGLIQIYSDFFFFPLVFLLHVSKCFNKIHVSLRVKLRSTPPDLWEVWEMNHNHSSHFPIEATVTLTIVQRGKTQPRSRDAETSIFGHWRVDRETFRMFEKYFSLVYMNAPWDDEVARQINNAKN